jgi:hypothetical protein
VKRLLLLLLIGVVLSGCASDASGMNDVITLRNSLQNGKGCSLDVSVTTDYGDSLSTFALSCSFDKQQNVDITVIHPETISGIKCRISGDKGKLTFDEKVLAFEMIADGQLTPISAPWLVMKALNSAYINAIAKEKEGMLVRLDDSVNGILYSVDLWLDGNNMPRLAEIVFDGKRIVSMSITNFKIL